MAVAVLSVKQRALQRQGATDGLKGGLCRNRQNKNQQAGQLGRTKDSPCWALLWHRHPLRLRPPFSCHLHLNTPFEIQ